MRKSKTGRGGKKDDVSLCPENKPKERMKSQTVIVQSSSVENLGVCCFSECHIFIGREHMMTIKDEKARMLPMLFQNDRIDNCIQLSRNNGGMLRMTLNKFKPSFSWDSSPSSVEGL